VCNLCDQDTTDINQWHCQCGDIIIQHAGKGTTNLFNHITSKTKQGNWQELYNEAKAVNRNQLGIRENLSILYPLLQGVTVLSSTRFHQTKAALY
jgi:hypothetical protein